MRTGRQSLRQRLHMRRLLQIARDDLRVMNAGLLVNGVFGHELMPHSIRWLGYRAFGVRIATPDVYPKLRLYGRLRNLEIGRGTFLNRECFIEAAAPVRIGRDCQLGPQVLIMTMHHPRTSSGVVSRVPEGREVRIGDRAWLGARVLVLPGVEIGADVVIAAGAVVAKDCLKVGLYAGVPAIFVPQDKGKALKDSH